MKTFQLGKMVVTRKIHDRMSSDPSFDMFVRISFGRYINCDWGDLSESDKAYNDQALKTGERIFAAYIHPTSKEKIYIITEWDRSVTTILFWDEY